ncbi:MAG: hypothetical protein JWM48_2520 [Mycobacterium sp.]|nr:hypothetical protein [Mycobacterium sp.]
MQGGGDAVPARWERLFADLDQQWQAAQDRELEADVAERVRAERSRVGVADRLRAAVGTSLTAGTAVPDLVVAGVLVAAGPDWVLLRDEGRAEWLLPTAAVTWWQRLGRAARPVAGGEHPSARLARGPSLAGMLRSVARDRSPVTVVLTGGLTLQGTVDGAGADALDLAEHPADAPRRAGAVTGVRVVPFAALVALRRGPSRAAG